MVFISLMPVSIIILNRLKSATSLPFHTSRPGTCYLVQKFMVEYEDDFLKSDNFHVTDLIQLKTD